MKIITIGDSILKGIILDKSEKYVIYNKNVCKQLEDYLDIKVENHSVFGQTLKRVMSRNILKRHLNETGNIVLLELGGNDSDYHWDEVCLSPNEHHDEKTPVREFYNLLNEAVNEIKKSGNIPVLCTLPPISSKNYFEHISKLYNKDDILTFFHGDISNIYRHQEYYSNIIEKYANSNNIHCLDLRHDFLLERNFEQYLCKDGIHLNELGNDFIFNKIKNEIKCIVNSSETITYYTNII